MMTRFFQPDLTTKGWRILKTENGLTVDVCGAVSAVVAWEQCAILNRSPNTKAGSDR